MSCSEHFGKTFLKLFRIWVKCTPDSKIIGNPPEDVADGLEDGIVNFILPIREGTIACAPFSEFASNPGGENCINQYKVMSSS